MEEKQVISSGNTFIAKFILPSVFYLIMIIGLIGLTIEREYGFVLVFFIVKLIFGILVYFGFVCLKKVSIDKNYIYISNYFKTVKVPFNEIENVTNMTLGGNYQPIFIHFKKRTEFGNIITFLNLAPDWFDFSKPTIVKELIRLSNEKTNG